MKNVYCTFLFHVELTNTQREEYVMCLNSQKMCRHRFHEPNKCA